MNGLPGWLAATTVLSRVWAVLPGARLVGGLVRDLLRGDAPGDIDLATPEPPDRVMALLRAAGIKVVPTGLAHGTVTAVLDGAPIEITTLRRDVETDGRHAVVAWTDDWREDAARRDFTINAMSADRHGVVHDYFDGLRDLSAGIVRFVGDPDTRLAEDALRALRFLRFHARFGTAVPDAAAIAAIGRAAPAVRRLSAERVWSEWQRLLSGPTPEDAVQRAAAAGLLDVVLPHGSDPARFNRLLSAGAPMDPILRLAALSAGDPKAVAARLRLSRAEAAALAALTGGPDFAASADPGTLRQLLARDAAPILVNRSWLLQADADASAAPSWEALRRRLLDAPRPVFPLTGADAVAAGLPPGPAVGATLRAIEAWWREGGCVAERDECLRELRERLPA